VEAQGFVASDAATGAEAEEQLQRIRPDIVLLDLKLPDSDGLEILRQIQARDDAIVPIVMTAHAAVDSAVEAMKRGALDYLVKPLRLDGLKRCLEIAARTARLHRENRRLRQFVAGHFGLENMIGETSIMQEMFALIRKVAPSDVNVLVTGESGTGKEKVARALHLASYRAEKPFVAVNCGAIPATLVESELFGHVRGAFTGAAFSRKGYFLEADGGTLFLDEIGEMPQAAQVKLLRAVENHEVRPVGSSEAAPVDVRLLAATNQDLARAVSEGQFREDLYYRLNVVQIRVPPLRERQADVPLLAQHFLRHCLDGRRIAFAAEALHALASYHWPGNVRELENVIRRACALASSDRILLEDLPAAIRDLKPRTGVLEVEVDTRTPQTLEEMERVAIVRTLSELNGDRSATARALGIDRSTLYRKMKRYGIEAPSQS
jgi:two-component system response regulator HydG